MKTGAGRACATGKNPAHCVLWKFLWHSRVVYCMGVENKQLGSPDGR